MLLEQLRQFILKHRCYRITSTGLIAGFISEGTAWFSISPARKSQSAHHQVTDFTMAQ